MAVFPKDPATNIENDPAGQAGHKKRFFSAGRAGRDWFKETPLPRQPQTNSNPTSNH